MKILQIPHGWNKGRIVSDICPTITISSWEANNFLVEEEREFKQTVLGAANGVARTLLATYYKIGTYNVFERGFMAVIEYEDTASDTEGMGGSAGGRCV